MGMLQVVWLEREPVNDDAFLMSHGLLPGSVTDSTCPPVNELFRHIFVVLLVQFMWFLCIKNVLISEVMLAIEKEEAQ